MEGFRVSYSGKKKQNLENRISNFKTVGDTPEKNKTYMVYEVPNTKTKNTRLKYKITFLCNTRGYLLKLKISALFPHL